MGKVDAERGEAAGAGVAPGSSPAGLKSRYVRLLTSLASCPRVLRLYPPGHRREDAYLDELKRLLDELLAQRTDPVRLTIEGTRVIVDGADLNPGAESGKQLGIMLARRRIASIEIRSGVSRPEIRFLVNLLGTEFKEILRRGGTEAMIEGVDHPHLEITPRTEAQESPADQWGGINALLAGAGLDQRLFTFEVMQRLALLRHAFVNALADNVAYAKEADATFQKLVGEFLSHPDWEKMSQEESQRALEGFLGHMEQRIKELRSPEGEDITQRIESLRSYFRGLAPSAHAKQDKDAPESVAAPNTLRFETAQLLEFLDEFPEDDGAAASRIRTEIEARPHFRCALLIHCELLDSAPHEEAYTRRRRLLLAAIESGRYPTSAIARTLRFVTVDLPKTRFEPREHLINAVVDATDDEEALQHFLVSLTEFPHHVHPILERLAARPDPFSLLARLLRVSLLEPFRASLRRKLREVAAARNSAFCAWARSHLDDFFDEEVFRALLKRGTELLGAICKEILMEGAPRERSLLAERLRRDGSETALRLLVLGMPFDGSPCACELLETMAEFRNPLAGAALREVVHRANTSQINTDEARCALQAILRNDSEIGEEFVRQVAEGRFLGLPRFRGSLRRIAVNVLESDRWM